MAHGQGIESDRVVDDQCELILSFGLQELVRQLINTDSEIRGDRIGNLVYSRSKSPGHDVTPGATTRMHELMHGRESIGSFTE